MADDSSPSKVVPGLVADIVRGYVAKNNIAIDQLGGLIAMVHQTLSGLGQVVPASLPELTPAVPMRRSVQPDHVVCLECGFRGMVLRRHLRVAHGLEPAEYRLRWKLPIDHPITAPAYSRRRSTMAKQIGLGSTRQEAPVPSEFAVEPPPVPTRRGRPRRQNPS